MNGTNVMKQYVCLLNRGGTVEAVLDDDGKIKVFKIFVEKEIRALTAGMVGPFQLVPLNWIDPIRD